MQKYRSIYFNDERMWFSHTKHRNVYDDIYLVGIQKSIGYIPTDQFSQQELNQIINSLKPYHDLIYLVSNRLWVGNRGWMQSILDSEKDILITSHWPTDAQLFFNKIARIHVGHDKDPSLYHVICKLFNSWCLWCEDSFWQGDHYYSVRGILNVLWDELI